MADAKAKFVGLKTDVRGRLSSEDAASIDGDVERHLAGLEGREAVAEGPESGLEEEASSDEAVADDEPAAAPEKVKWKLPVVISLAGAGVVGGVLGGVMFVSAGAKQRDAQDLAAGGDDSACAGDSPADFCGDLQSALEKEDSAHNLGVAFAATGGVLLAGALVTYLVVPNEKPATSAGFRSLRPLAGFGKDGVSVALTGRF